MILSSLKHEYSKVVSEGLRVAGSFTFILRKEGESDGTLDPAF